MDWEDVKGYAKKAGARFPECVAAQWALESNYGKHLSGKYKRYSGDGIELNRGEVLLFSR